MTRQEALALMITLKTAYPAFYKNYSKDEINAAVDLWATMFADDPAHIVTEAVKSLMCTLKYPPTIADVKEKIALITQPQAMTEMEAWNLVAEAIQNANYYAQDYFDGLPPILQKIIGSPNQLREWAQMDSKTVNSVVQSNFMRSYKAKAAQEREYAILPDSTKQLIAGLSEKLSLMEGTHEPHSKCPVDVDEV